MLTRRQRGLVAVACRDLGLSDEAYRDVLEALFGVRTSKRLGQAQYERLIAEFKKLGFRDRRAERVDAPPAEGMMTNQQRWRLLRLCERAGIDPDGDYFRGVMRRAAGCDRVAWLTARQAAKVIDALREVAGRVG